MNMNVKRGYFFAAILFVMACPSGAQAHDADFFAPFHSLDRTRWSFSNGWVNGAHQACEWREDAVSIIDDKLQLKLSDRSGTIRPYGCPEMHTIDVTGYGFYEARMRTASGSGLNTAFFTYVGPPTGSPEHDEIDFEFLGKDTSSVEINYFTNGQGHHGVIVPLGFDASQALHDYAIEWKPDKIRWYVDGKMVHETPAAAAMPRNPTRLYLSLWSGSSVEDSWMGPFHYSGPVTAQVEWAAYTPSGKSCLFPQSVTCNK